MKKLIPFIVITLMLSFFALPVFAEDAVASFKIKTTKATVSEGDTFSIYCRFDSTVETGGFQFDIYFDNSRFEYVSHTFMTMPYKEMGTIDTKQDSMKKDVSAAVINSDGYFRSLYLYNGMGMMGAKIVTINFKAKQGCYAGKPTFDARNVTIGDKDANPIPYAKISALVTVEGPEAPVSSEPVSSEPVSSEPVSSQPVTSGASSNTSSSTSQNGSGLTEIVVGDTGKTIIIEEGKTNYTIPVDGKTESIDLSGITKKEDSTVITEGGDNLKEGENTVKVTVTDKDGSVKEYTINVVKGKADSNSPIAIYTGAAFLVAAAVVVVLMIIKNNRAKA